MRNWVCAKRTLVGIVIMAQRKNASSWLSTCEKQKRAYNTSFGHRRNLSRAAIAQFRVSLSYDLYGAIVALKQRLEGVLEVVIREGRHRVDIFLGRLTDKNHGHIIVATRRADRIVHSRPYGCRYS